LYVEINLSQPEDIFNSF